MKQFKIYAPCNGMLTSLRSVNELLFSARLVGDGVAIKPDEYTFRAPCDGVVSAVFKTDHAVVLKTSSNHHILLYVGMNTISMNSIGIECLVKINQSVKKGEPLIVVNPEYVLKNRIDLTTIVVLMEARQVKTLDADQLGLCKAGESVILSYKY